MNRDKDNLNPVTKQNQKLEFKPEYPIPTLDKKILILKQG
jgi:hypothetical protein